MSYVYKKPGSKCSFVGCSANKRDNPERVFFSFPVNNSDICKQWVFNCANETLTDLSDTQLSYRSVCSHHFKRKCFTNDMKKRLEKDAVPTELNFVAEPSSLPDIQVHPQVVSPASIASTSLRAGPSHISPRNQSETIADNTPISSPIENTPFQPTSVRVRAHVKLTKQALLDTPRKTKLKKRLNKYKASLKLRNSQLHRLKEKSLKLTKEFIYKEACKNIESYSFKTLLQMQLLRKQGTPWLEEEKQLAIELFYRSPSLYKNLRDDKEFELPSTKTISRWLNVVDLMPGVSEELLQTLKLKVKNMSTMERQVILIFDEMSIKRALLYNEKRDIVEGFEDFGRMSRTSKIGDHILLFMVRGLMAKWKIPVAYYVTANNVTGETLEKLLRQCLSAVSDIGLDVRATVCDQGPNNQRLSKLLHASS